MSQARTYPAGVTSWIDVEHTDLEAAMAFYGGLLGWTFNDATPPGATNRYLIAQLDGQDVAGMGLPTQPSHHAAWNTYVATDDIEATVAAVTAAGGQVLGPPADVDDSVRVATVTDDAGVELRLCQAGRRLGAQLTNAPGTWNFSDLWAEAPEASKPFYEQVFGWQFADLGFATMIRRPGYGDHLAATSDPDIYERQASVNTPPGFADAIGWLGAVPPDQEPGWHVTFTVA